MKNKALILNHTIKKIHKYNTVYFFIIFKLDFYGRL